MPHKALLITTDIHDFDLSTIQTDFYFCVYCLIKLMTLLPLTKLPVIKMTSTNDFVSCVLFVVQTKVNKKSHGPVKIRPCRKVFWKIKSIWDRSRILSFNAVKKIPS